MSHAPQWFRDALGHEPQRRSVVVDGATIVYRAWGDPNRPGLVLVHGGSAHSGWWDHVAPQLTSHRVVALDLSGHGDSDWRHPYSMDTWAREVVAVADAEQLTQPVVIGHSMGGWVSLSAGSAYPDRLAAVAVLDSPLNDQPPEEVRLRARQRPTRIYASIDDAVARFTTIPQQDVILPFVGDHIARTSLRQVEGGWTWKFDPRFFGTRKLLRDVLPSVDCPVALFRSEYGLVTREMADEMSGLVRREFAVVDVPSGHHPMLDEPLALVTGLRTLLALWPHSVSR